MAAAVAKAAAAASDARKSQVRTVDRSERIRTYNFPENRIADHRVGYKANNLDRGKIMTEEDLEAGKKFGRYLDVMETGYPSEPIREPIPAKAHFSHAAPQKTAWRVIPKKEKTIKRIWKGC